LKRIPTSRIFVALVAFVLSSPTRGAEAPNFFIGEWSHLGDAIGQYYQGIKICPDGRGSLYVLEHGGAVLRFTVGGRFIHSWPVQGHPLAMDLDPSTGQVVLLREGWIDRYDAFGNLVSSAELQPPPDLDTQSDIAVDSLGNVFVIGTGGWISAYGPGGGRATTWPAKNPNVKGIAVSPHDEVYLVGIVGWFEGGHVWKHDPLGPLLGHWELPETKGAETVAWASDGTLYVGAWDTAWHGKVLRYDSTGNLLATWSTGDAFLALAVDVTGLVLVSHVNARVALFAPPPPAGIPVLQSAAVPGFRFGVRIQPVGAQPLFGHQLAGCMAETICASGSLPGRSEVLLRVVGPKPNGKLWPTLVKLSTSTVEVWVQQLSTGALRYYTLYGPAPGDDSLAGLFDRNGFSP
jgi:hypothetical protein